MRRARAWLIRLGGLVRRKAWEERLSEELQAHIEMDVEDGIRSGLSEAEARRQAMLRLGGLESVKESYRDRRGIPWLETLWRDLSYAGRMMRSRPAFTAAVVLTLALGIGATTAIFTVVSGVLLRPLPFPDSERLVYIATTTRNERYPIFAYTWDYASWRANNRSLRQIAGYMNFRANSEGNGEPERLNCALATASLFPLLGVQPLIGRAFSPEEDRPGGPNVALLEYGYWQRRFGGERSALGRTLTLDGEAYTIIGVLPREFGVPDRYSNGSAYDVWVPFAISDAGKARQILLQVVGRLRPGVTRQAAVADLMPLLRAKLRRNLKQAVSVVPWQEHVASGARRSLILFFGAVGLLLVIACVNVANLLLARGEARRKEIAVRRALGAGRGRIVRQLLTESVLTALGGGILGLALAYWGKNLLLALIAPKLPALEPIGLDSRVLLFNLALSLLTGVVFGIAPALQASGIPVNESLKESARGSSEGCAGGRVRNALVVTEVALAIVLLSGAGLLFKTFLQVRGIDMGFRADRVLAFDVNPTPSRYPKKQDWARFLDTLLQRLERLPGVESAGGGSCLPLTGASLSYNDMTIEGYPDKHDIMAARVSPGYFRTLGIPLLKGRSFTSLDREGAPGVAIVNRAFAQRYFSTGNDLGRRIESADKDPQVTVAGVVGDVRAYPERNAEPQMYLPYSQTGDEAADPLPMSIVVRAARDPLSLAAAVRGELAAVDRMQPPYNLMTLDERRAMSIAPRRVTMLLTGSFAALALTLGCVGVYGVLAWTVGQRRHEIGIRVALGAHRGQIIALVLRKGVALIAAGSALGVLAGLAASRLIASELWGVKPRDPETFVAVVVIVVASGLAACWLPARHAARMHPITALRHE